MDVLYRNFKGITAEKLIEVLKTVEPNTKICIDILNDNFPVKTILKCEYYSWNNGKKQDKFNGILIK